MVREADGHEPLSRDRLVGGARGKRLRQGGEHSAVHQPEGLLHTVLDGEAPARPRLVDLERLEAERAVEGRLDRQGLGWGVRHGRQVTLAPVPTLDQLSGEKQAILELVLRRGQSYDDIAAALGMPVERVREHARESLAALAPRTARRVDGQWRGQVADYLLGQQSGPEAKATRAHLKSSEPARAWALSTLDSLGDLYADGREPFIPAGGRTRPERSGRRRLRRAPPEPAAAAVATPAPALAPDAEGQAATADPAAETVGLDRPEPPAEPEGPIGADRDGGQQVPTVTEDGGAHAGPQPDAEDHRDRGASEEWRAFKRRGRIVAIVTALALLAILVILLLLLLGGGEEPATETVPTTATDGEEATGPTAAEVPLQPVGDRQGGGVARVISQEEGSAVSVQAKLPPTGRGEAYVVWLANSPDDSVPVAAQATDRNGNFGGNAALPPDHEDYRFIDILAQDVREPTRYSGQPILRGDLEAAEEIELEDGTATPLPRTAPAPRGSGNGPGARQDEGSGDGARGDRRKRGGGRRDRGGRSDRDRPGGNR